MTQRHRPSLTTYILVTILIVHITLFVWVLDNYDKIAFFSFKWRQNRLPSLHQYYTMSGMPGPDWRTTNSSYLNRGTSGESASCMGSIFYETQTGQMQTVEPRTYARSQSFPPPQIGLPSLSSGQQCFDRDHLYEQASQLDVWPMRRRLYWGKLQEDCSGKRLDKYWSDNGTTTIETTNRAQQAVLIRTFTEKTLESYTTDDIHRIRTMIMQLSLQSGGEYQVFFLLHVKTEVRGSAPNLMDWKKMYLHRYIPQEFRDMVIVFDEETLRALYPLVNEYSQELQNFQPIQYSTLR